MRRTTYIMITLIVAGVVLVASFLGFVRCAGEQHCNDTNIISAETDTINVPNFESIRYTDSIINNDARDYRNLYILGGDLKVEIVANELIETPYIVYPVAFDADAKVEDGVLYFSLLFKKQYYVFNDGESASIEFHIPADMSVTNIYQ